ncbi:MAG: AAA family ATPase [Bacilli bacterium]
MKRKIYSTLLNWKNTKDFKPIMLLGARQVGKTYIINEFCKNEYKNFISVNLFERKDIVYLYKSNLTSIDKFNKLKVLLNYDIEIDDTILFIDEIQESEELISELKYFCEKHNSIRIICAGSLLGVKLKRSHFSFPVGKVTMINMYPMDFEEFLLSLNEELLINEIKNCYNKNIQMSEPIHLKAMELYRLYLCVGGMPESINNIISVNRDIINYDTDILKNIVSSYSKDMNKYVLSSTEALKIENTYRSIPNQLANESNKFQFSKITNGSKSREYVSSIDWLESSNMIMKSYLVKVPSIPLKGFVKNNYFKLFLNDVGILSSILELKFADVLSDNLSLYKGIVAENYVASSLMYNGFSLYYWISGGKAEVDFLIYTKDGIIPVEVKSSTSVRSKSLDVYIKNYNPKYSIRISGRNFGFDNGIKSIPLYAVFCIKG